MTTNICTGYEDVMERRRESGNILRRNDEIFNSNGYNLARGKPYDRTQYKY